MWGEPRQNRLRFGCQSRGYDCRYSEEAVGHVQSQRSCEGQTERSQSVGLYREEKVGFEVSGRLLWVLDEGKEVAGPAFKEDGVLVRPGQVVGKLDEIQYLTAKYPHLTAYLPHKVAIFAENKDTLLVTVNPVLYKEMIDNEQDKIIFDRWESDIYSVFDDFSSAAED